MRVHIRTAYKRLDTCARTGTHQVKTREAQYTLELYKPSESQYSSEMTQVSGGNPRKGDKRAPRVASTVNASEPPIYSY